MMDQSGQALLEETSPNGNVMAVVDSDGQSIYFYLMGDPQGNWGMRTCWVRNLVPAPNELDVNGMQQGRSPSLPAPYCAHPQGLAAPRASDLRIVWFEEGDGAALMEREEVLAIIPCWSGQNGFHGYARDCTADSPLCWALGTPETNVLFDRVRRAREYWVSWNDDLWPAYSEGQLAAYEAILGKHAKYYAIDGGEWPPKAMLRHDRPDAFVFTTAGMSLRPQPAVELYFEEPSPHRRIELALAVDRQFDESVLRQLGQYVSAQAALPWSQYTWLGDGHTVDCGVIPSKGEPMAAVLLLAQFASMPTITLPAYRGDPVKLLWIVPITSREREFAQQQGSEALRERLLRAGVTWIARARKSVI